MGFRISELFGAHGGFHDLAVQAEAAVQKIAAGLKVQIGAVLTNDLSDAKQHISDTLSLADTALAKHHQAIALAVEQAIDTELAAVSGGMSIPFNAITNDFLDRLGNTAAAAAHNAILSLKARMAPATPPTAGPTGG